MTDFSTGGRVETKLQTLVLSHQLKMLEGRPLQNPVKEKKIAIKPRNNH